MNESTRKKLQADFYSFYLFINEDLRGSDGFRTGNWEEELCDFFQYELYYRFLKGERPIATSEEPVQHGKSTKLRIFTTWLIGRHGDLKFNFYTSSDDLRDKTQAEVLNILQGARYKSVFGNVIKKANASTVWFKKGGQIDYRLMGEGNTGYPSHISIIDDPYRNAEDALSPTIRAKVENRFRGDIMSRRQNNTMVLVLHSRWHTQDLIGMLKTDPYFKDKIISSRHPAIDKNGNALFPEFRSIDFLREQEKALGSANFAALYQQEPIIEGGNLIKTSQMQRYDICPAQFDSLFIVADTAFSEKKSADNSAFGLFGTKGKDLYMLDGYSKKVIFPDLRRDLKSFFEKAKTYASSPFSAIYIENKGSGISLIQQLREEGLPIRELQPTVHNAELKKDQVADKYLRFNEVAADLESGYFHIPASAPWLLEFLSECEAFTGGKQDAHDDYCDVLIYALKIRRKAQTPDWSELMRIMG